MVNNTNSAELNDSEPIKEPKPAESVPSRDRSVSKSVDYKQYIKNGTENINRLVNEMSSEPFEWRAKNDELRMKLKKKISLADGKGLITADELAELTRLLALQPDFFNFAAPTQIFDKVYKIRPSNKNLMNAILYMDKLLGQNSPTAGKADSAAHELANAVYLYLTEELALSFLFSQDSEGQISLGSDMSKLLGKFYYTERGSFYYRPMTNKCMEGIIMQTMALAAGGKGDFSDAVKKFRYTQQELNSILNIICSKLSYEVINGNIPCIDTKIIRTNPIITISAGGTASTSNINFFSDTIGKNIYYDLETCQILTEEEMSALPDNQRFSFRKLYGSLDGTSRCPKIDAAEIDYDLLVNAFNEVRESMNYYFNSQEENRKKALLEFEKDHAIKEKLDKSSETSIINSLTIPESQFLTPLDASSTFYTWADQKDHRVADMFISIAHILLRQNPHGSFFLVGTGRNGKTTFLNFIRTLIGSENTASISFEDLNDYHHYERLARAWVNIAEENVSTDSVETSTWKIAADAGSVDVSRMYSQEGYRLTFDFPMFFCYNVKPSWDGRDDSTALARRTLIINFTNDLSASDREASSDSFETKTFTPEFMSKATGWILGTCAALVDAEARNNQSPWSREMIENQIADMSTGEAELADTYLKQLLCNGWTGFSTWNCLIRDFDIWRSQQDTISDDDTAKSASKSKAVLRTAMPKYTDRAGRGRTHDPLLFGMHGKVDLSQTELLSRASICDDCTEKIKTDSRVYLFSPSAMTKYGDLRNRLLSIDKIKKQNKEINTFLTDYETKLRNVVSRIEAEGSIPYRDKDLRNEQKDLESQIKGLKIQKLKNTIDKALAEDRIMSGERLMSYAGVMISVDDLHARDISVCQLKDYSPLTVVGNRIIDADLKK